MRAKKKVEDRVNAIMMPTPFHRSGGHDPRGGCARDVELIKTYNVNVQRHDALIKELVRQHSDYEIVALLPGSAELSHARLIAALGDDRTQYENATSLQNASGISPITTQSGTTRIVSSRWLARNS
ncbi:MAG: transposase [Pirellulaceae bacterium]